MIPRVFKNIVFAVGALGAAAAMAFPTKPIQLMVPYPAGGASDVTARAAQGPISNALGVPVVVENLGGANGMLAANKVLAAPSDGYYMFQGSPNELILAGLTNKAVRYQPLDFEMLHPVAVSPYVVLVRAGLPVKNVDELLELARTSATPLSYGTGGMGSQHHLVVEDFGRRAKAKLTHVPYRGGAPVLTDLVGGQLDFTIFPMQSNYVDFQREGKLRILATLEPKRLAVLPDVPSVEESMHLKGFHYTVWTAYLVKKGTPQEYREKLRESVVKSLDDPGMRRVMDAQGKLMFSPMSLKEAEAFYQREVRSINELFRASGFRPE
jgi:tripartite-type tricarboxylate transporter receptor subunit TctC